MLVILLLAAILWDDLSPALFAWFAAILIVTVARYALSKAFFRRDRPGREIAAWGKRVSRPARRLPACAGW
jgi:hypothetical protein